MSKKHKKSHTRDNVSRFISIFAVIISILFPVLTLSLQYREHVSIEISSPNIEYFHALSVHWSKGQEPELLRIAVWRRFTVRNNSNKSLSIISIDFTEDNQMRHIAVEPFFQKVWFEENRASCSMPLELPIFLVAGETISFYALLPITVPEDMRSNLYKILWGAPAFKGTLHEIIILIPNFFQFLYMEAPEFIWELWTKSHGTIDSLTYNNIDFTRILFEPHQDAYVFIDSENSAPDGFRFKRGSLVFAELNRSFSVSELPALYESASIKRYTVETQTNSGRVYKTEIPSNELPFSSYVAEILERVRLKE